MSTINVYFAKYTEQLLEKSGGYFCGYCGKELQPTTYRNITGNTATVDHIVPISKGGTDRPDNLMLACFSCNALKRNRGIEDLRFYLSMKAFEARTGVRFTPAQVNYLKSIEVQLDMPSYVFRYELIAATSWGISNDD